MNEHANPRSKNPMVSPNERWDVESAGPAVLLLRAAALIGFRSTSVPSAVVEHGSVDQAGPGVIFILEEGEKCIEPGYLEEEGHVVACSADGDTAFDRFDILQKLHQNAKAGRAEKPHRREIKNKLGGIVEPHGTAEHLDDLFKMCDRQLLVCHSSDHETAILFDVHVQLAQGRYSQPDTGLVSAIALYLPGLN